MRINFWRLSAALCARSTTRVRQTSSRDVGGARTACASGLPVDSQPSRHERAVVQGRPGRCAAGAEGRRWRRSAADDWSTRLSAVPVCVGWGRGSIQVHAVLTARRRAGVAACSRHCTRFVTVTDNHLHHPNPMYFFFAWGRHDEKFAANWSFPAGRYGKIVLYIKCSCKLVQSQADWPICAVKFGALRLLDANIGGQQIPWIQRSSALGIFHRIALLFKLVNVDLQVIRLFQCHT